MKVARIAAFLIVLVVALAAPRRPLLGGELPAGDARVEGFDPARLGQIQGVLDDLVARRKVAGAVTMVVRHGKVVHLAKAGRRDVEANRPLDRSTLFRIASMTKPITSAAVMALVDDGIIKLDDPVSKFLPEFASPSILVVSETPDGAASQSSIVPAARPITIHHLLTHTSGLAYRFAAPPSLAGLYVDAAVSDGLAETPGTIAGNVRRLARLPLAHQPGARWTYGLSTDVLGRVVEAASGKSFDEFLRDRLFRPLRMDDTGFLVPGPRRARLAAVYMPQADGTIRRAPDTPIQIGPLVFSATFPAWDTGRYYSGGAGLISTIDDYARFLQMVLNKGELEGARVLRPETVEAMSTHQIGDLRSSVGIHGLGFGYGFGIVLPDNPDNDPAGPGALSWAGFFHTQFWIDVRTRTIGVMMSQLAPGADTGLPAALKRLTYEAMAK